MRDLLGVYRGGKFTLFVLPSLHISMFIGVNGYWCCVRGDNRGGASPVFTGIYRECWGLQDSFFVVLCGFNHTYFLGWDCRYS